MDFFGATIRHVLDLQVRTVGGHPGPYGRGHAGRQVAAQMRGAEQHDLRFVFLGQLGEHLGIRIRLVMPQLLVVDRVDPIHAVSDQPAGQRPNVVTGQHGGNAHAQLVA